MARIKTIDDELLEAPFNKTQFFRLLKYMKPYRGKMLAALALMVVYALCGVASPFLMSQAVSVLEDLGKGIDRLNYLPWFVVGMILTAAVGGICLRARVRLTDLSGRRAIATLRQELFDHIQTLSFNFFDSRSAGKIMVRVINDVNSLNDLFSNGIINLIVDCLTLVLLVTIMLFISWQLTLVSLVSLTLLAVLIMVIRRRMRRSWQVVRMKTSTMNGYLHESLSGMRVTQAFTREGENQSIYDEINGEIHDTWLKAVRYNNLFWPAIDITSQLGTVLVYLVGLVLMGGTGGLSLASLMLILWYLGRFWDPINNLANFYNALLSAMASVERIYEIFDTPADIHDEAGAKPLPPIDGEVTFDHVTFSYDKETTVLDNVSFTAQPGQTIALVGPTGAGKSTVVNLISRFYDVTDGRVLIDGHDVRGVTLHSLRSQMSVMLQDSFIFSGTIMENIRYGRLTATDEEVIEVAKTVYAHDFIMQMEKGYETVVNERGSSLSAGQKQLISFARALLNDPRILILDEATSSIDTRTEQLIQRALERLLKGRTSFVIAHRLSTIRKADCILVVQDGHIAERGTHDELIRNPGGHYRALCEAQYAFMQGTRAS
ncbi:MAG: ABC transporter ATP-binding protein/permease [Oscillospiraceae bacterium]|jgi:ATP-binding cassette subfamily B protein|nr:ABC transporter ATP-binding protein/permease [Oscillospiraceae bacterium]